MDTVNLKEKAEAWKMILLRNIQKKFQGGPKRSLSLLCTYKLSRPLCPEGWWGVSCTSQPDLSPGLPQTLANSLQCIWKWE